MINLLPKQEKSKLRNDFYLRFAVVFFYALGGAIFIGFILLLPSYFLSVAQKDVINRKLITQKNSPAPENEEGNSLIISQLNSKLTLVEERSNNRFLVSRDIISEIISDKMPDIKIINMNYYSDSNGKNILINGTAPSRERLLLFRIALESNLAFKKVDLPISNFIKGSNIQFSLKLTPN